MSVKIVKEWMEEMHTLQELLASILAEEGIVLDGSVEIVDHELEDRLNLLFCVASVDGKGSVLEKGK